MHFGLNIKATALLVIAITLIAGCFNNRAASNKIYSKNSPTNDERLNYGRIGVATGRFNIELQNIQRRGSVSRRRSDHEIFGLFLLNLALFGPYGLDYDFARYTSKKLPAAPKEQWASLETVLNRPENARSIQRALGHAIIERVNLTDTGRLSLVDGYGPNFLGEEIDYSGFKNKYDTMLELSVTKIGFESLGGIEPKYNLYMSADIKIVKIEGNTVIYHDLFKYSGEGQTHSHWLANDGIQLKEEIGKGVHYLAWQISLLLNPIS